MPFHMVGPQPHILAPPVSIASISACDQAVRRNLFGSSLLSKYIPSGASILPKEWPLCPPIAPYACEDEGTDAGADDDEEGDDLEDCAEPCEPNGPCC